MLSIVMRSDSNTSYDLSRGSANSSIANGKSVRVDSNATANEGSANEAFPHFDVYEPPPQPSRDFANIPPHRTTADEVLIWPIFEDVFPKNYLIDPQLGHRLCPEALQFGDDITDDCILPISNNIAPLDEQRIPSLIDRFLENVHTKNPILDVESLVRKGRSYATKGLGWDGHSCLLLMACALGLVAKPFGSEREALDIHIPIDFARELAAPSRDRDQADHCFVQASRRLGGLRPSVLSAQCQFFAGVYLMYTLRPMLSWQYFYQASVTYQLYLKMSGRITDDNTVIMDEISHRRRGDSKTRRLEQRIYWSCFKSEAEFRVELPLPQSEIASYEFPNLFPSPPSPLPEEEHELTRVVSAGTERGSRGSIPIAKVLVPENQDDVRIHAKRLCNEEESWYYYLTEVALRRIGNRIINTFFQRAPNEWTNIEQFIDVAVEFEAQVSTWQTNLPPAMQKYETSSAIRAPRLASPGGAEAGFVSRELSWATENRLLEMRHWLYQPFLYYLVHSRPAAPAFVQQQNVSSPLEMLAISPGSPDQGRHGILWPLIARAIDCNLTILDTRSVPHRHHGLWYDLRAIICSTLLILAVVKAGYLELIPGGRSTLVGNGHGRVSISEGTQGQDEGENDVGSASINGKFGRVLRQLEIWSQESPDMIRAREVLEMLIWQIMFSK